MKIKRIVKSSLSIMLILVMIMSMFPASVEAAKGGAVVEGKPTKPPVSSTSVNYVALGDSIATGTVDYWSSINSYVYYFHQYLKSYYGRKTTVNLQNLAEDGDRTNELLDKLRYDENMKEAVINADIITISIGGNNLMQAASIPGFTDINWELATQGATDFINNWQYIITEITSLNKRNAKIIVMTVYNPFNINPPYGYSNDVGLHEQLDNYVSKINDTINGNIDLGYKVADIYTAFDSYSLKSMGDITYFYPSLFSYLFRNPHPNSTGQSIITNLHKDAFGNY